MKEKQIDKLSGSVVQFFIEGCDVSELNSTWTNEN